MEVTLGVSRSLALLSIAANVLALGIVVLAVAGGRSLRLAAARDALLGHSPRAILGLAFLVALTATLGSLFYSEIAGLPPCLLCWYQRIAMYPLTLILGVAALRGDASVARYVVPLAAIGAVIAGYHYALEWFPALESGACDVQNPCSVAWFRTFGFISLPYMALSGFVASALLTLAARRARDTEVPG